MVVATIFLSSSAILRWSGVRAFDANKLAAAAAAAVEVAAR